MAGKRGIAPIRVASSGRQSIERGRGRLICIGLVFLLSYLTIAVRVVELAFSSDQTAQAAIAQRPGEDIPLLGLIRQDPKALAALKQAVEGEPEKAEITLPRADIRDRNGIMIATSVETASLFADAREIRHPQKVAVQLKRVLPGLDLKTTQTRLASDKSFVWIQRNLTPREQQQVNNLGIPGIHFQTEYRRIYPQGDLLSHVLGFVGVDNHGLAGVEKFFDRQLLEAHENKPLDLAIDLRLQYMLQSRLAATMEEFNAIGATGVIVHIPTGEVVALSSLPSFDPHHPGKADPDALFNRATLGTYELGSTFKTFTLAMALENGVGMRDGYDATHPIRVGGFTITDYHAKARWLSVPEIFAYSSNIGTVRMAMEIGKTRQKKFLGKLGLLEPVSLELPERAQPLYPADWRDINMMTISYGHGISVSPMHLVQAVSWLAGDGKKRRMTLLKTDPAATPGGEIVKVETSRQVRRLMRTVVQYGTARQGEAPGYRIGGKTGTSEKISGKRYSTHARIASFIGVFPTERPEYAVFAMIDEPKGIKRTYNYATGGWVAAPLVADLVGQMGPMLGIQPVFDMPADEMDQFWEELHEREKRGIRGQLHAAAYRPR